MGLNITADSSASRLEPEPAARISQKPKLLLLAWNFPPVQAIASVRTWNIAKHLSRLGWAVTVVTPNPALFRFTEEVPKVRCELEKANINRILTGHRWRVLSPIHLKAWNRNFGWAIAGVCRVIARRLGIDDAIGWIRPTERACADLTSDDVDLILASGPPFSSFVLAERLSRKLDRPYVLDYRDLWTDAADSTRSCWRVPSKTEARLLARASAVIAVSESLASHLHLQFEVGPKLQVTTNGYDLEELGAVMPLRFDHFAIVYAGTFYPPERVITPVLDAIARLKATGESDGLYFHYYGEHEVHVMEEAARLGVINHVKLHGKLPRTEVLSAIRGAHLAVVVTSVFDEGSLRINAIPGKLFEVLGLGTRLLLIAPPGSDAELISQQVTRTQVFTGTDIGGIADFIRKAMRGPSAESVRSKNFDWSYLADRLDVQLRKIIHSQEPLSLDVAHARTSR